MKLSRKKKTEEGSTTLYSKAERSQHKRRWKGRMFKECSLRAEYFEETKHAKNKV